MKSGTFQHPCEGISHSLGVDVRNEKDPFNQGLLLLIPVVNDSLVARTVLMILLNYGSALGWLTFFDHSMISVSVVIPVPLADGYASANGADANTNIFSQRRCNKRRHGGDYQCVLHQNLLSLLSWKGNYRALPKFRNPKPIAVGTFVLKPDLRQITTPTNCHTYWHFDVIWRDGNVGRVGG
jgi:hypothetical protein